MSVTLPENFREEFPWLNRNPEHTYLDAASTSLRSASVLQAYLECAYLYPGNPGRGNSPVTNMAYKHLERSRENVRTSLALRSGLILFLSSATEAMETCASLVCSFLPSVSSFALCADDHRATFGPWSRWCERRAELESTWYRRSVEGAPLLEPSYPSSVDCLVLTSVFNGTGYIQGDLAGFGSLFGDEGLLVIDSSQEIGRGIAPILRDRADALIFSGHKVFGALGTGVLWLSDRMVAKLDNSTVAAHAEMEGLRTSARHPHESITAVVERASPNLPAISAFCAALKLSQSWGASAISQVIRERVVELLDGLKELKSCQIVSNPFYSMRSGIVAFRHTALTPKECEAYLGESNVFVRGGNLCRTRSKDDVVRVSVHCYTSQADISRFVRVLSRLEGA